MKNNNLEVDALTVQELISTNSPDTSSKNLGNKKDAAESYTLTEIFNQLSLSGELSQKDEKVTAEIKNVPTESETTTHAVTETTSAIVSPTSNHSLTITKDPQSSEDYGVSLFMISYAALLIYFHRTNTTILKLTII